MIESRWIYGRAWGFGVGCALLIGCAESSPKPAESESIEPAKVEHAPAAAAPQSSDLKQAIAAIQTQRFEEAKGLLLQVQAQDPKNAEAAFYLGVACEGLSDVAAAEPDYRRALTLDPRMADASVNLSALLINKGSFDEALTVIEQGLKSSPGHEGLLNNRAMALSQSGKAKEAAETYAVLLQKRPDDVETKALYAEALVNAGENEAALSVAQSLLSSTNRDVLALAADLFGRTKAFGQCVEALDKAIAIKDAAELRVHRGLCLHGKHDETKAQVDFQAATETDPKNAAAFYYLGQSWVTLGKTKQAKTAFTQAIKLAGDTSLGKAAKKALAELK